MSAEQRERKERALQMFRDNVPIGDIEEATGYSRAYLYHLASPLGIKRKRVTIRDYGDQIMLMDQQGKTYSEIGEAIGYSPVSVRNYIDGRKREEKRSELPDVDDEDIAEMAFPQKQLSFEEPRIIETPLIEYQGKIWRDVTALYCPQ